MIEETIIDYLEKTLAVPVSIEKPSGTKKFVLIDKTGGGEENKIKSATIAIQSYDETLFKAAALNEEVKAAMESMKSETNISSVRLNTDYNFTDAETKEYRYQATYDLVYME